MHVFFRADASSRIGAGHVVRCLTLADSLAYRGAQTCFICRPLPDALAKRVRSHGHELIQLPATDLDDSTSEQHLAIQGEDAKQTRYALSHRRCDWLIVDHYSLDDHWERAFRDVAPSILVIDDLANRQHECDLLLDQNYYADLATRYDGLLPPHTRRLLGPTYALLRPQFAAARANPAVAQADRLFVSLGATDPFGVCLKVVASLRTLAYNALGADIVVGADHEQRIETVAAADGITGIRVHGFIDEIAAVMTRCTVAVGAAGGSTWERCAIGLPSIVVITADNQRKMAIDLAQTGVILNLGEAAAVSVNALANAIDELIGDPVRRSRMRLSAMNLVDGQGAQRVTDCIMEMARCTN